MTRQRLGIGSGMLLLLALLGLLMLPAVGQTVSHIVNVIVSTTCSSNQWVRVIGATGAATCSQPEAADVSGLGTAAIVNTGTSGATIPLLNANNTFSGTMDIGSAGVTCAWQSGGSNDINCFGAPGVRLYSDAGGIIFRINGKDPAFTLAATTGAATVAGTLAVAGMTNVATTSAVCYNTSTGLLTYNSTVGTCTVSALSAKNLIGPLVPEDGLKTVLGLQPWRFTMKEGPSYVPGEQVGMIADFSRAVDSRLVVTDGGSFIGFRYEQYTAVLTAAIQAQQLRIDKLQDEIESIRTAR